MERGDDGAQEASSDSEIELPIPEWGSSSDEDDGVWDASLDEVAVTPTKRYGLVVAVGTTSAMPLPELEDRVREHSVPRPVVVHTRTFPLARWGETSRSSLTTCTFCTAARMIESTHALAMGKIKWESLLFWGTEHGWTTAGQTDRSDTDSGEAGAACHATPSTHTLLLSAIVELTSTGEGGASDAATDLPPDAVRQICSIDGVTSAAMWACGPCPIPVTVVPICDLTTERENIPKALQDFGMAVVPGALSPRIVGDLRKRVHHRIAEAEAALKKSGSTLSLGTDEFAFYEMASRGRQRFDLLLELPAAVLTTIDSAWRSGVAEALGCDSDAMRVQVSAVYSRPGAPNQDWHSDGGHLDRDGGWGSGLRGECLTPARPYALCVFVPLVDLTAATGFTSFWPGSHRHAGLLGFGPAATALGAEVDGMVSAGTALAYDYRLLHRGRANVGDTQRELVQFLYSRDYIEAKNYGQTRLLS